MSINYNEDDVEMMYKDMFNVVKNVYDESGSINNDILLDIYGLYKQSSMGNVKFECDFKTLKEKRMWENWNKYKGMSKLQCIDELINIINDLVEK